jgi:hypothetical protein
MRLKFILILCIVILTLSFTNSCKSNPSNTTSSISPSNYSLSELKYKILAVYPDYFWCDPDFYPGSPEGPNPVEKLSQGMIVYTVDSKDEETTASVSSVVSVPVPSLFRITSVILNDGRVVSASPGRSN